MPDGPVTIVLRGFRVPVATLDRFLEANGLDATEGYAPFYHDYPDDEVSKLLCAKMGGGSNTRVRLFIPYRMGRYRSTLAYVAYDWVFVYAQRRLNLAEELPESPPVGFGELCNEIMKFAEGRDEEQHEVGHLPSQEDMTAMFVINTDEQSYRFREPYVRKSDLRCEQCDVTFPNRFEMVQHRRDTHGSKETLSDLPEDL